jgi:hypothetical protein
MEAVGSSPGVALTNNIPTAIVRYAIIGPAPARRPASRRSSRSEGGRARVLAHAHLLAFSRRQVLQPKVLDLNAIVDMETILRRLIRQVELGTSHPGSGRSRRTPARSQVIMNLAKMRATRCPTEAR